jgi:CheY-like chemotaxis protein
MTMESVEPVEVLLVEDDPGDVYLTREALARSRLRVNLRVVEDGEAAMSYLRKQGAFANAPTPDLVLLDLNLPRKNGHEVIEEAKADAVLRRIPLIVLSTSQAADDITRTYSLGANCYITKPLGFERFAEVVRAIEAFWFTTVRLPSRPAKMT